MGRGMGKGGASGDDQWRLVGGAAVRRMRVQRVVPARGPTSTTHRSMRNSTQSGGHRPVSACVYSDVQRRG
jgi:hypothetical protein